MLTAAIEKNGDAEVVITEKGYGGQTDYICDGVSEYPTEIYAYMVGGEDYTDYDVVKELFPEWDGDEETVEELEPTKGFVLTTGTIVYSS